MFEHLLTPCISISHVGLLRNYFGRFRSPRMMQRRLFCARPIGTVSAGECARTLKISSASCSVYLARCRSETELYVAVICSSGIGYPDSVPNSLHCSVSVSHWHSARSAWNGYQPGLGSIPRPGRINCLTITGVHALRLISRTGKRVWRCPL